MAAPDATTRRDALRPLPSPVPCARPQDRTSVGPCVDAEVTRGPHWRSTVSTTLRPLAQPVCRVRCGLRRLVTASDRSRRGRTPVVTCSSASGRASTSVLSCSPLGNDPTRSISVGRSARPDARRRRRRRPAQIGGIPAPPATLSSASHAQARPRHGRRGSRSPSWRRGRRARRRGRGGGRGRMRRIAAAPTARHSPPALSCRGPLPHLPVANAFRGNLKLEEAHAHCPVPHGDAGVLCS